MKRINSTLRMILLFAACLSVLPVNASSNKTNKAKKDNCHGTKSPYNQERHERLVMATVVGVVVFAAGLIYNAQSITEDSASDLGEQLIENVIPAENNIVADVVTDVTPQAIGFVKNKAAQVASALHSGFMAWAKTVENVPFNE